MALPDKPLTRQEMYLSRIAGENTELPREPLTREEMYLEAIANGGGGGGSSDFNDLDNRPQLNGTAMTGNTNITDFVGTDGTNAGAQGLVPAPTTADVDKFLKSDGTWATAGGGSGPTVVQTTGTSTTDVMSQKAVTDTIFFNNDPKKIIVSGYDSSQTPGQYSTALNGTIANNATYSFSTAGGRAYASDTINMGHYAVSSGQYGISIGANSSAGGLRDIAIGNYANSQYYGGSVALGANSGSNITTSGIVDVGSSSTYTGYNQNSNYRLITGVHDAQNAHDAVTLGQLNALITELQALGLNVSLQGAGNAGQNSSSSADPGSSAEPEPEPGGGSAQAPTYPYYEGTHVFYLYNGQEVYYDETSPVQDLYYRDGTLAMAEADWCQDEGQGTVYYCGGSAGGEEPAEPAEPTPEDAEAPVEG